MSEPFTAALAEIIRRAETKAEEGDYRVDGLLYCGRCNTPKQCRPELLGGLVVGCRCSCQRARDEELETQQRADKARLRAKRLRESGIMDPQLTACRFETAEKSEGLAMCQRYVDSWEQVKAENLGIILCGEPGSGKTYAAACVANALIDKGVGVVLTSFPRLLNLSFDQRRTMLDRVRTAPLLIIDDLGVERDSPFGAETVYTVVDERYKAGRPLIVTTNLTVSAMAGAAKITDQRIFGRVLEMCTPVVFRGGKYRQAKSKGKAKRVKDLIGP